MRWPTIRAEDAESCGQHPGATDALNKTAEKWGTPHGMAGIDHTGKQGSGGEFAKSVERWGTLLAQHANGTPEEFLRRKRDSVARGNSMGISLSDLNMQVQTWPTPGANDHKGSAQEGQRRGQLDEAVEQKWCTPNTMGGGQTSRGPGRNDEPLIDGQAQAVTALSRPDPATSSHGAASSPNAPTSRPRLNPAFVEWLMGMPHGWTDFAPVGTEWSDWQRGMRSCLFSLVSNRSEAA